MSYKKCVVFLLFSFALVQSQNADRLNYFPISIGNTWQYSISGGDGFEPFYYDKISIAVVGDSIFPDDNRYYIFEEIHHYPYEGWLIEGATYNYFSVDSSTASIFSPDSCTMWYLSLNYADTIYNSGCNDIKHFVSDTGTSVIDSLPSYENQYLIYVRNDTNNVKIFHEGIGISYDHYSYEQFIWPDNWVHYAHNKYLTGAIINGVEYGEILSVNNYTQIAKQYKLFQSYPNPFNSTTTFQYKIPVEENIVIKLFNINGQLIDTIHGGKMSPGIHKISWDSKDQPSGIYFMKILSRNWTSSQKLTLLK